MRLPAAKLARSEVGTAGGSPARHAAASLQALGARSEPLELLRRRRRQRQAEQDADDEDSEVCREHVLWPGRQTVRYKTSPSCGSTQRKQPGWQLRLSGCEEVGELFQSKWILSGCTLRVSAEEADIGFKQQQKKQTNNHLGINLS